MKTWRERTAEARGRGEFSEDDHAAWCVPNPDNLQIFGCPARQALRDVGLLSLEAEALPCHLWDLGNRYGAAMGANDFDAADRALDAIDDAALALKRESA